MKKIIRDGQVAVLYSPGYGADWYSWHSIPELVFHPTIVEMVEQNRREEITEELVQDLLSSKEYICVLGAEDLRIAWLPEGAAFTIDEYDGAESITTLDNLTLVA